MQRFVDIVTSLMCPPVLKRNPASWLKDPALIEMYTGTEGAHNSPDPVECWMLYNLAKLAPNNVLEIGSWRGRSSAFLAKGIKDSKDDHTNKERRLACLDWFVGDKTGGASPDKFIMLRSLIKFDVNAFVDIYDQNMLEFDFAGKTQNVDLVFYDADHNTEPTKAVLNAIHPVLNPGCIVTMHDANWNMTRKAIYDLSEKYKHIGTLNVWEGFAILAKI